MTTARRYHHGDLRRALLAAAAETVAEVGPAALSLRELARRAGVSHAAPAHHFGDKAGLLTAMATQGFELLGDALARARDETDDLLEVGVAYVRFAVDHRAHFEVMFRPELYRTDDPALTAARARAGESLHAGVATVPGERPPREAALAAWSIVHGFASLWLGGALPRDAGDDPATAARSVIRLLFDADHQPAGSAIPSE